jgi:hypothetical protein
VRTPLGRRWARVWLSAYNQAQHGVTCDACRKWLSNERKYHYEYSNGFNYFLCITCRLTDVKPPELDAWIKVMNDSEKLILAQQIIMRILM